MKHKHYVRLFFMAALSFASMYVLMYAMVNTTSNIHFNFNQTYMAGLMTAPMLIIELALMGSMYEHKKLNITILGASLALLIMCWTFIRQQTAISDKQFLKSMIPHHASAILMCERASLEDVEIKELCKGIISNQQGEIQRMNTKLRELK